MSRCCHYVALFALVIAVPLIEKGKADDANDPPICFDGDLLLSAMLLVRRDEKEPATKNVCLDPNTYFIIRSEALIFAIDRVNRETLAPIGVTLGLVAFDYCFSQDKAVERLFSVMNPVERNTLCNRTTKYTLVRPSCLPTADPLRRLVSFSGTMDSPLALNLATRSVTTCIPAVSTDATSTKITDASNVVTTDPLNDIQAELMVAILLHFNVTNVNMVMVETHNKKDYTQDLSEKVKALLNRLNEEPSCKDHTIELHMSKTYNLAEPLDVFDSCALIVIADYANAEEFFLKLSEQDELNAMDTLFILSDGIAAVFSPEKEQFKVQKTMKNTLGLGAAGVDNENFEAYLLSLEVRNACRNPWLVRLIELRQHCSYDCASDTRPTNNALLRKCFGNETLKLSPGERLGIRAAHHDYAAVQAVAQAILRLHSQHCPVGFMGLCSALQGVSGDELFRAIYDAKEFPICNETGSICDFAFNSQKSGPPFWSVYHFREDASRAFAWEDVGFFNGASNLTCTNYKELLAGVNFTSIPNTFKTCQKRQKSWIWITLAVAIFVALCSALLALLVVRKIRRRKAASAAVACDRSTTACLQLQASDPSASVLVEALSRRLLTDAELRAAFWKLAGELRKSEPNPESPFFIDPQTPIGQCKQNITFDRRFEVDSKSLIFVREIGHGNFGTVYLAQLLLVNEEGTARQEMEVAVKTPFQSVERSVTAEAIVVNYRTLHDELRIMSRVRKHANIVNLLGAVVNVPEAELKVVIEYCAGGNLLAFLKGHRRLFINEFMLTKAERVAVRMQALTIKLGSKDGGENLFLTSSDLLSFAFQISSGMSYLSSLGFVHRDLAARNILLTNNHVVKIADLGLMREDKVALQTIRDDKLPIRWTAIEVLQGKISNANSDIWSFGVVLWEVFSLGQEPYSHFADNADVCEFIQDGGRLSMPEHSSPEIYRTMQSCWDDIPQNRPRFSVLKSRLDVQLRKHNPDMRNYVDDVLREEERTLFQRTYDNCLKNNIR